jgi:hypothetical protein
MGPLYKGQPDKGAIGFENIKRGLNLSLDASNRENKKRATLIDDLSGLRLY